jgi:hypothetical protein
MTEQKSLITEEDFNRIAASLDVEPASVKAVNKIESPRGPFLPSGKPYILFEGHVFWKELQAQKIDPRKYRKGNEDILYPSWTKVFYKGGEGEYGRLERAMGINEGCALRSASWGAFQIMGFNHKACGFKTVQDFVQAQRESATAQLEAFVSYIKNNKPTYNALRQKNWDMFARLYNGASYAKNAYHLKLAKAYKEFSRK